MTMDFSILSRSGVVFLVLMCVFTITFVKIQKSMHSHILISSPHSALRDPTILGSADTTHMTKHEDTLEERISAIDGVVMKGFDSPTLHAGADPIDILKADDKVQQSNLILEQANRIRDLESALAAARMRNPDPNGKDQPSPALSTDRVIHKENHRRDEPRVYIPPGPGQALPIDPTKDISVTYDSCMDTLRQRHDFDGQFTKRFSGTLFWLHFPKCGTSFGSTLHGFMCQAEPSNNTDPLPPHDACKPRDTM